MTSPRLGSRRWPGAAVFGDRMASLAVLRLVLAVVVLGAAALLPGDTGGDRGRLAAVGAAYLVVAAGAEAARRRAGKLQRHLAGAAFLLDGVYLASALALTGGPGSLLDVLVMVHIVAVTLAASYRTGLKVAMWHSLLFLVVDWAQAAALLPADPAAATSGSPYSVAVSTVAGFWLVAIGAAAFSAVNERQLRRGKAELAGLARLGTELAEVHEPGPVLQVLLARVLETFGYARAAAVIVDPDGRQHVAVDADGTEQVRVLGKLPVDAVVQRCWDRRESLLLASLGEERGVLNHALPGARNVVLVPIVADGKPLGALAVERGGRPGTKVTATVVSMLAQFGHHGALALRNAWLLADVERLANSDGLTGLANRRVFEAALEREVGRAERTGGCLSLAVVDVDHFKKYNDTHGHQAGDEILRQVAAALAGVARSVDLVARYGGEEFVVVLPDCPAEEAAAVAERLRHAVTRAAGVTVSAGVATLPDNAGSAETLVRTADEALYESKEAGRDRVTRSARQNPHRLRAMPA